MGYDVPTPVDILRSHLVYDGVPVEAPVLLHVAGVSVRVAQVAEGGVRPQGAGGDRAEKPVHVVAVDIYRVSSKTVPTL